MKYRGYISKGNQCVIDLFLENGKVCMFITSCIYKLAPLKSFCSTRSNQLLIDPLLFSFILANQSIYIEDEVFVLERCSNFSWLNEVLALTSWQIQSGLIELLNYSYKKNDIVKMVKSSYTTKSGGNYIRMLLESPLRYKRKIVFFLGLKQFRLIFKSFLFNFIRLLVKPFELTKKSLINN